MKIEVRDSKTKKAVGTLRVSRPPEIGVRLSFLSDPGRSAYRVVDTLYEQPTWFVSRAKVTTFAEPAGRAA